MQFHSELPNLHAVCIAELENTLYFSPPQGNLKMEILRYEKDARSIPVTEEQNGVIGIGPKTSFSIKDKVLYLTDPDSGNGTVPVGTHMQYTVKVN